MREVILIVTRRQLLQGAGGMGILAGNDLEQFVSSSGTTKKNLQIAQ